MAYEQQLKGIDSFICQSSNRFFHLLTYQDDLLSAWQQATTQVGFKRL
jgi:hypothetical protein